MNSMITYCLVLKDLDHERYMNDNTSIQFTQIKFITRDIFPRALTMKKYKPYRKFELVILVHKRF